MRERERADLPGTLRVPATAQIVEPGVAEVADGLLLDLVDQLKLVGLVGEDRARLVLGDPAALDRHVALHRAAHPPLDAREVLGRQRTRQLEVVVEAVLDRRPDRVLALREHLDHGLGEDVRGGVAHAEEALLRRQRLQRRLVAVVVGGGRIGDGVWRRWARLRLGCCSSLAPARCASDRRGSGGARGTRGTRNGAPPSAQGRGGAPHVVPPCFPRSPTGAALEAHWRPLTGPAAAGSPAGSGVVRLRVRRRGFQPGPRSLVAAFARACAPIDARSCGVRGRRTSIHGSNRRVRGKRRRALVPGPPRARERRGGSAEGGGR